MSFEIKFLPTAEKTYLVLTDQLRERWGEKFVAKLDNKITASLNIIIYNPYIYPIADDITEIRKCVLHKNCSMFYKIQNNAIIVTWFWDNRQDPIFIL